MKKTVLLVTALLVGIAAVVVKTKRRNGRAMGGPAPAVGFIAPQGAQQAQADAFVTRALDWRFSSIQPQNGAVKFVGTPGFSHLSQTSSVGQNFQQNDRHHTAYYSVVRIEPDAVVLSYRYTGTPNLDKKLGRVRAGTVKLKWKSATPAASAPTN